jgi:hypothetical protein
MAGMGDTLPTSEWLRHIAVAWAKGMRYDEWELARLRRLSVFRALPWYRRAWLTLTGKAPR